jgi:hypothetical protein
MPNSAIKLFPIFLLLCSNNSSGRCDGGQGRVDSYLKTDREQPEIRDTILVAAGWKKRTENHTYGNVIRHRLLVTKPVSCIFSLDTAGQISTLKIYQSSGSDSVDERALALIRNAAPFGSEMKPCIVEPLVAYFTPPGLYIITAPPAHGRYMTRKMQENHSSSP